MSAVPERRNENESKETPKSPERQPSPRESGEFMRAQGDRMTEETMDSIDDAWDIAEAVGDPAAEQKLEGFREEAKEAKQELVAAIERFVASYNERAQPFVWTKPAAAVLTKAVKPHTTSETEH